MNHHLTQTINQAQLILHCIGGGILFTLNCLLIVYHPLLVIFCYHLPKNIKYSLFTDIVDTTQCLKTRHVLAFMGFLGFANVYAMRVNLSVAIVAMVNSSAIPQANQSLDICPGAPVNTSSVQVLYETHACLFHPKHGGNKVSVTTL